MPPLMKYSMLILINLSVNNPEISYTLAAIRGEETVAQLAAHHGLHPTQINSWKRQLIEQAAEVFSKDQGTGKAETHSTDDLHRIIGN